MCSNVCLTQTACTDNWKRTIAVQLLYEDLQDRLAEQEQKVRDEEGDLFRFGVLLDVACMQTLISYAI